MSVEWIPTVLRTQMPVLEFELFRRHLWTGIHGCEEMTLAEAVETLRTYCHAMECANCVFNDSEAIWESCTFRAIPIDWKIPTETNIFDQEEIHENCTVQLLKNSITGEVSVGWWDNE